jgi:UTP--glucose-1-phosphate uridylyltransferase
MTSTLKPVRKAVIAAAGFGTRFLPQTKAMPKEMLPLVDKPIIQYVVEELVAAGIEDIIIVSGYSKRSIEDHFDLPSADLVKNLEAGGEGKRHLLEQVNAIADLANFVYVRQKGPYGNATPVMSVEHLIGDEPFIYTYADEIVVAKPNCFKQMVDLYNKHQGPIFPCIRVDKDEDFKRYGIVAGDPVTDGILKMSTIIEKPGKDAAPSNFASVGGYLLTPNIFSYLHTAKKNIPAGDEFKIQPAMQAMIEDGLSLFACEMFEGVYYNAGDKLEYLKTVVDFALKRDDIKDEFREYLRSVV